MIEADTEASRRPLSVEIGHSHEEGWIGMITTKERADDPWLVLHTETGATRDDMEKRLGAALLRPSWPCLACGVLGKPCMHCGDAGFSANTIPAGSPDVKPDMPRMEAIRTIEQVVHEARLRREWRKMPDEQIAVIVGAAVTDLKIAWYYATLLLPKPEAK
jgi:hypothetical protein